MTDPTPGDDAMFPPGEIALPENERGIRKTLSLLSAAIEAVADGILVVGRRGEVLRCNRRFLDLWGIPESAIPTAGDHQLFSRSSGNLKDPETFLERMGRLCRQPGAEGGDIFEFVDGRVFERRWRPWKIDAEIVGRIWSFHEVSGIGEATAKKRESDERYRRLFESVTDVVLRIDRQLKVIAVSPSIRRQLGYCPEELVGRPVSELRIMETLRLEKAISDIGRAFAGERLPPVEYEFISKEGTRIFGEVSTGPVHNQGEITLLISIAGDITDRKRAEEALRQSQAKYRFLADRANDIIWTFDIDLRPQYVSPSVFRVLGYTPEERRSKPLSAMLTPESFARAQALFASEVNRDLKDGVDPFRFVTIELEYHHKNGSMVWLENVISAVRDAEGRIIGIQGASRDVTARRRMEAELREREETFRSLFENMNEGVALHQMLYDEQGRAVDYLILDVNPAYKRHTGITPEQIKGVPARQFYGVAVPPFLDVFENVARTGKSCFFETFYPPMGRYFAISAFSPRKGWFATVFSDVSGRKKMELNLQESFERLRKALGATVEAMAVTVETRDPYTAGHQRRVADLARSIASEMGLDPGQIESIYMAAAIHDIGKISVPAEILSKPTVLKDMEFQLIKIHAQAGYDIIKDIDFPWPIARILLEHHERMDGSGYPNGLTGDKLLTGSRVLAVADVVEAIASHRPYRPSRGIEAALLEIGTQSGILYDPEAVDACSRLFRAKGYAFED